MHIQNAMKSIKKFAPVKLFRPQIAQLDGIFKLNPENAILFSSYSKEAEK